VLPKEAAEREVVRSAIARVFSSWGYEPVETPVVEVYETLAAAAGELEGTAFRLFDLDGQLLALRPDVTVPVARLIAARLGDVVGPKRFRYDAQVFREHESLRGQARQFTQVGVELVDASGPAADAEIVAMVVEALRASGLADFSVAVGDVGVLFSLIDAAGDVPPMDEGTWRDAVLAAAHDRNVVAFDALTRAPGVPARVAEALRMVVRTSGTTDAIQSCRAVVEPVGSIRALDDLERTWELLEAAGVADRVVIDFGVMRSFDYYTGLVLEAYAPGLGVALGGGGRYDAVLGSYGRPAPAAGFALGLERLTIALAEQGVALAEPSAPVPVYGADASAFAEAARRRAGGERVVLQAGEAS
jgi:ATP phosphoribosyltransferase regulatory subunit